MAEETHKEFLWELAQNPIASSSQAAVTAITTTHTTTTIAAVVANLTTLLNQIRSDLVTAGIIKGSA
jgi:hypothetical protein